MNKKEIKALIHLLDDPDTEISDVVTGNLKELGIDIIPELESAWESTMDLHYQEKIENIIQEIQAGNVKKNLTTWRESGSRDLLEGVFWVAKYQYPDLEIGQIRKQIDRISGDIWLELNNRLTALEKVRIINHILFDVHKFSRNNRNFYAPGNSFINLLLESKKGNPVSLAILYILVAKNLSLPIYGINLPKIFILAYMDEYEDDKRRTSPQQALFYINPYHSGAVLGKREIDHYLAHHKIKIRESFFTPFTNEEIIKRLLLNLTLSYEKLGYPERLKDLREFLKVL